MQNLGDKGMVALGEGCPSLKYLEIYDCPQITNVGLGSLARSCTVPETCNLSGCWVGDSGIIAIARGCPQLNRLSLTGLENLGYKGMVALGDGCPLLKDLEIWLPSNNKCRSWLLSQELHGNRNLQSFSLPLHYRSWSYYLDCKLS
ncbi:F-box LRR-repeat 4 [Olea europaea subsp. europaea]|uniref:F-box LRR-repeat 4 n=1 Tax=Olea europaea subsp. europaea TaxID=158383 RepID=A0A8S0UQR5_OLEEU|nr:F-box LRR-repeat 4 [Olea europaea subsp. europaea]